MIESVPAALAAFQTGAANPDPVGQTLSEFLESGGELMIPLGICSVLVLGFFLERLLALRRARICPARLDPVFEAVAAGRFREARQSLEADRSPAARILLAGLRRRGYPLRDVEGAMEDQAGKELEKLRHNVRPLVVIGGIAPLLGLLGTVLGIAEAFRRVSQAGMGKPEMLAGGIEMALSTTIVGLCIAIPAILASSWLQGRVRKAVLRVDERIAPLVETIAVTPETARGDDDVRSTDAEQEAEHAARAG